MNVVQFNLINTGICYCIHPMVRVVIGGLTVLQSLDGFTECRKIKTSDPSETFGNFEPQRING